MFSINGVSLHEGHHGWRILREGTTTVSGVTSVQNKLPVPGRPGYKPAMRSFTEQMLIFSVRTPRERLDELLALCDAAHTLTRTDDPTKMARVELVSAISNSDSPFDAVHTVTITLSAYEGVWRDADLQVFGAATIGSPSQDFELFPGLSAPIWDADIFIRGVFGNLTITDSGGSWLRTTRTIPNQSSTRGLLIVGSTGQAFIANESAPWTPVSDATQFIETSGNGGFRLTPKHVAGSPATRRVELKLVTLTQTSTTLRVRARRAYWMN